MGVVRAAEVHFSLSLSLSHCINIEITPFRTSFFFPQTPIPPFLLPRSKIAVHEPCCSFNYFLHVFALGEEEFA